MKKALYTLSLFMLPIAAIAQPTINNALNYNIGATVNNIRCNDMPAGPGGANQTWNFAGLTPLSMDTIRYFYEAPASIAPVSGSNLVERSSDQSYIYLNNTPSQLEILAIADSSSAGQGLTAVYTNSVLFLKRPLTFGLSFVDSFNENYTFSGYNLIGSGTIQVTVDGYGSLSLPTGNFSNVLRVRAQQVQNDTVQGIPIVATLSAVRYMWFDSAHRAPLLRIDSVQLSSPVINNSLIATEYLAKEHDPVNVPNITQNSSNLGGHFNGTMLTVTGNFRKSEQYELAVFNLSGQKVYTSEFVGDKDRLAFTMNKELQPGVYLLSVFERDNINSVSCIKLIKQ